MTRYGLVCLLLGLLSCYHAANSSSTLAVQTTATVETTSRGLGHGSDISNVPPDKPLITIAGLCDNSSVANAKASNCKTVITQTQFEKVIDAIQPNMSTRTRREFALRYADALVMAKKAEQMGLDKGANYEEQMKLARIQILSQDMKKVIQEKVSQISEKDIEDYYHNNIARFEKAQVDRIYVPKNQQPPSASDKKQSDADSQDRSQGSEQTIKDEADNLRARAVAGEEFTKLQADAYRVAGIRSAAPTTSMVIRRTSLPPSETSIMDLNSGEISAVLVDPNGYAIYRVKTKDALPLNQVREEIKETLRSQRMQDEMRGILDPATPTLNESYFAR